MFQLNDTNSVDEMLTRICAITIFRIAVQFRFPKMIAKLSSTPSHVTRVFNGSRLRPHCCSTRSDPAPLVNNLTTLTTSRRAPLLSLVGIAFSEVLITNPASAAKIPRGFNAVQDKGDGYQFLAPFGWQEVDVKGLDAVYKVNTPFFLSHSFLGFDRAIGEC